MCVGVFLCVGLFLCVKCRCGLKLFNDSKIIIKKKNKKKNKKNKKNQSTSIGWATLDAFIRGATAPPPSSHTFASLFPSKAQPLSIEDGRYVETVLTLALNAHATFQDQKSLRLQTS